MSTVKQSVQGRVLSCKESPFEYEKGTYSVEVWIETPYGSWAGKVSSSDNTRKVAIGEMVFLQLVEAATPPNYIGLKSDYNFYVIL